MNDQMSNRKFALVKAKDIVPSSILPTRRHDPAVRESVKRVGVQQPLIVRPLEGNPNLYEVIDGHDRADEARARDPEQMVIVEIRKNASDAEVFRISEATFKRTEMTAFEKAYFYHKYVKAEERERGEKRALSRVAEGTGISESMLSQYQTIYGLFAKLWELSPESHFPNLESMGINKLYELSQLVDNPKLLQVAQEVEKEADNMTVEGINQIVRQILDEESRAEEESILESLGDSDATSVSTSETSSILTSRFEAISEKIAKQMQELNKILLGINTESFPKAEKTPEALKTLEKTSVNIRRLLLCLRKIEKLHQD